MFLVKTATPKIFTCRLMCFMLLLFETNRKDPFVFFYFLSQSKLAFEKLPIQKVYHPFICGPNNSTIKQLIDETGVKINVPPLSVMSDEIVVSGEKEGVMKCKETIMAIYEEKVRV